MHSPIASGVVCTLLALIALARALGVLAHDPLLAIANNFDQIRYSACLHIAPARPGVPAQTQSPTAPLREYAFQPVPSIACTMTSDFVVTAPLAATWWIAEHLSGVRTHSIRDLGMLRLVVFVIVVAFTFRALRDSVSPGAAIALLAWFALVAMDPANVLYFSTFYAEPAALLGWFVCACGVAVALLRPCRGAWVVAGLGALALGTSKYQHLILPLLLALALLLGGGAPARKAALAVALGGVVAFALQVGDAWRQGAPGQGIAHANRANFTLSLLLPMTSDRARVETALDIEPACAAYAGKSIFYMPGPVESVCTHVGEWSQTELWWLLLSDPPALTRAIAHTLPMLLPWLPMLGVVEAGYWQTLPSSQPSLAMLFADRASIAWALILLPWLVFGTCLVMRAPTPARAFALMCAFGSAGIAAASMFGEGIVDFAKHSQLVIDISLASLCIPMTVWIDRARVRSA